MSLRDTWYELLKDPEFVREMKKQDAEVKKSVKQHKVSATEQRIRIRAISRSRT